MRARLVQGQPAVLPPPRLLGEDVVPPAPTIVI